MTIWESIFLGFLQGVTEFLPISSSGHLAVARNLLGIKLPGIQFEVALHLATLLSVFVVYRAPVKELCLGFVKGDRDTFYYLFHTFNNWIEITWLNRAEFLFYKAAINYFFIGDFFNKLGTTVEIKNEKSSINFWATSGMMAPFYELLKTLSDWLIKRGIKRNEAQKYITSLFVALSEDSSINSKKDLKYLVKDSQTSKGLNEQAVKQLRKAGFYRNLEKSLNGILKRLNKV